MVVLRIFWDGHRWSMVGLADLYSRRLLDEDAYLLFADDLAKELSNFQPDVSPCAKTHAVW